jgi:hypothetical protein
MTHDHEHDHEHHDDQHANHDAHALAQVDLVLLPAADATAASIEALLEGATERVRERGTSGERPVRLLAPLQRIGCMLAPGSAVSGSRSPASAGGARNRLRTGTARASAAGRCSASTRRSSSGCGCAAPRRSRARVRLASSRPGDIGSIGSSDARALDPNKVNDWLSYLLQSRGQDILRMKGVLNLKGEDRRYVFHGVHMVFDGQLERPWSARAAAPQPPGVHWPQSGSPRARGRLRILHRMSAAPGRLRRASASSSATIRWMPPGRPTARRCWSPAARASCCCWRRMPPRPPQLIGRHEGGVLAVSWQPGGTLVRFLRAGWRGAAVGRAHASQAAPDPQQPGMERASRLRRQWPAAGRLTTGRALLQLFDQQGAVRAAAFTPGTRVRSRRSPGARRASEIAAAGNGGCASTGREPSVESRDYPWRGACLTASWNADGRLLAAGMQDGSVHLWNVASGDAVADCTGLGAKVFATGWSASGRYLATAAAAPRWSSGTSAARARWLAAARAALALRAHQRAGVPTRAAAGWCRRRVTGDCCYGAWAAATASRTHPGCAPAGR